MTAVLGTRLNSFIIHWTAPSHPDLYTMIGIDVAIAMNAEGVRLLCMGNLRTALCAFQEAMLMARQAADSVAPRVEHHGRVPPCPDTASGDFQCQFQHQSKHVEYEGQISFIYARPMLLCTKPPPLTHPGFHSYVYFASSVILFNFAMTCHRCGLAFGSDTFLKRAIGLYELTLNMVTADESDDFMFTVLECVVLNNLAQIYYDQCNYDQSDVLLSNMYDILMTIDSLEVYLSAEEIESLMSNKLHMEPPRVACAA